jgi:CheY-like chemotaxis protein
MRLLYVEDNRINALLFEETLKLHGGFELRVAEDGEQALQMAREWLPDVLVLDSHLPDLTGTEVLRALRTLPGYETIPAFMCSADALQDDISQALQAGFYGYWSKPIDIDRILSDLRQFMPATTRDSPAG